MSEQLTICLIAVAANLGAMLIVVSMLSHVLVPIATSRRGVIAAVVVLVVSQIVWIGSAIWIVGDRHDAHAAAYALWFGNWLVSGFSAVLLLRSAMNIPRALHDSARTDGLGAFAEWRHTILPFVSRDLTILGVFTLMATLLPFWAFINLPQATDVITIYERSVGNGQRIVAMLTASFIGVLPLIAILFLARRRD